MAMSRREELYERLPVPAAPDLLYDLNVVVTAAGRFLTVVQAWHGPQGVTKMVCLPGALPLGLLGTGFGTNLPQIRLMPSDPPVLLLGTFAGGRVPALRRAARTAEEDEIRSLFPGYGRFAAAALVSEGEVVAGDILVLEDGRPYEVTQDAEVVLVETAGWSRVPGPNPVPLETYLARRDLTELPLTRLTNHAE